MTSRTVPGRLNLCQCATYRLFHHPLVFRFSGNKLRLSAFTKVDVCMAEPQMTQAEGCPVPGVGDEALIVHWRSGDSAAGDELVRRYARPLLAYLGRLCGNMQLAEEVHQQTWLSVLENLDRFDGKLGVGSFKAWLFRIATNKANDLWRARGRQKKAYDGLRLIEEAESPDASVRLEAGEKHLEVQQALDRLPETQKQVVLMRYYAKMKFTEIAETLGCPLNTALGRMHKATLKLREMLGAE